MAGLRGPTQFLVLITGLAFFFVIHAHGFYLPGVAPRDFQMGNALMVKMNKLSSMKNQLPYSYYSLLYNRSDCIVDSAENLGKVLRGDRIENSPYVILDNLPQVVPVKRPDQENVIVYQHGFHVDLKGKFVGSKEEKYFIHNHLSFTVKYHRCTDRVSKNCWF